MNDREFREVERIFHDARAMEPADRASFLDEACAGDLPLRAEVESLLTHADGQTRRLDLSPEGERLQAELVDRGPLPERAGARIGRYKILQEIGEGGFGAVYMAEQQVPVQRRVALKIIKLGMDTKQVIARFEAERQALAMMDHPNIASVLDAGATETGRPYFVMELVKGVPITDYCDANKLSTRDRLELFIPVCHAVQHAHLKGIIHRDIKPSNVLVTLHDSRPVPKVIDFGIAKATSRRLTEKTLFTEFRQLIGTPEYMSPDQAEISGLDVDTRTDIYSLGVLLYELLTGTTPFDPKTLRTAAYAEVQRIIREVEPPRPSTRVETLDEQGTDIASQARAEPGSLSRLIRGDLDWIVMKAMEKDRTRRYDTANELAGDVRRHLNAEPVMAGPPSVVYKLRKFVVRHRLGAVAGLVIALALITGLTTAALGLLEARREATHSQRIADLLQDLFVSTNPDQALSRDVDVEAVAEKARGVFGDDHAAVAATLSSRALQLQSTGDLEAAERLYHESLGMWRDLYGEDNINVGSTLGRLGLLLLTKGDDAAAEEALRGSLRITGALAGEENIVNAESMGLLASVLTNRGQYDEAETLLRRSWDIRRAVAPHQRLQLALTVNSLANVLVMKGDVDAVREIMPETVAAWRDALPPDSPFLASVLTQCGLWYVGHEDLEEAESLLREAVEVYRGDDSRVGPLRHAAVRNLFRIVEERGDRPGEAIAFALEALELGGRTEGAAPPAGAMRELGNLAWRLAVEAGRPQAEYETALDAIERALVESPESPPFLNTLGVLQYRLGRHEEALETLARSHAHYAQTYEGGVPADLAFMAMAHHALGHDDEAAAALTRLRTAMRDPELGASDDNKAHHAEAEALLGDG